MSLLPCWYAPAIPAIHLVTCTTIRTGFLGITVALLLNMTPQVWQRELLLASLQLHMHQRVHYLDVPLVCSVASYLEGLYRY